MLETFGGKGANLAEMARLGLPVPDFISTQMCEIFFKNRKKLTPELYKQILKELKVEIKTKNLTTILIRCLFSQIWSKSIYARYDGYNFKFRA